MKKITASYFPVPSSILCPLGGRLLAAVLLALAALSLPYNNVDAITKHVPIINNLNEQEDTNRSLKQETQYH